jgi:hypothetical protein
MAIVSRSKKDSSCSGRRRPNPNKRKTVRKAELKSKLVKLSDRRGFIAKVELRAPACSNHGKTDRPVKKFQRHFRCQGMDRAQMMLSSLEMSIRPKLYDRQKINEEKVDEAAERQKVCNRIETWTSELVMDVSKIGKEKKFDVEIFLEYVLKNQSVEIVYLHGATPLLQEPLFEKLLQVLQKQTLWSLNLGELKFSKSQLERLKSSLELSCVTHMFYECDGTQLKDVMRDITRANRTKHSRWKYGDDHTHNKVVQDLNKNWFNPHSHTCNKEHEWHAKMPRTHRRKLK